MLLNAPGADDLAKVVCAGVGQCRHVKRATMIAGGAFKITLHAARYKVGGPAAQGAAALERGICARPALTQQRQHVVTDVVAVEIWKPVGRNTYAVKVMFLQTLITVYTQTYQSRA